MFPPVVEKNLLVPPTSSTETTSDLDEEWYVSANPVAVPPVTDCVIS